MTTSVDVVNRALEGIASQSAIAALTDVTPEGIAASLLYAQLVSMLLRQMSPEFARRTEQVVGTADFVLPPWQHVYQYPVDCVRLMQVMPFTLSVNDPVPMRWSVQTDASTAGHKVIWTNQLASYVVYISSAVTEDQWDSTFQETMVRMLSSELAMPIGGRPDFSKQKLIEAGGLMQTAGMRDS